MTLALFFGDESIGEGGRGGSIAAPAITSRRPHA
jgi:hypothetical protein